MHIHVQFDFGCLLYSHTNTLNLNHAGIILIMRHQDGSKMPLGTNQEWMKQTMDWIGGIAAQNKFVPALACRSIAPKLCSQTNGYQRTLGDTRNDWWLIMVRAESIEEAVEFAKEAGITGRRKYY